MKFHNNAFSSAAARLAPGAVCGDPAPEKAQHGVRPGRAFIKNLYKLERAPHTPVRDNGRSAMSGDVLRRSALSLLSLFALCAAGAGAFASAPEEATPRPGAPASRMPERPTPPPQPVAYSCDDGTDIIARFPDSSLAMLIVGPDRYELTAGPAASGVRYTGGSVEFWTHQGAARFTRNGKETQCRQPAQPASDEKSPSARPGAGDH